MSGPVRHAGSMVLTGPDSHAHEPLKPVNRVSVGCAVNEGCRQAGVPTRVHPMFSQMVTLAESLLSRGCTVPHIAAWVEGMVRPTSQQRSDL